jgi:transposase
MSVIDHFNKQEQKLAILIDPDKASPSYMEEILSIVEKQKTENVFFFVGGSVVFDGNTEKTIQFLKERTRKKIILFPGTNTYISEDADAFLLLSLISGRNPEWLISRHVSTAIRLKKTDIETISTSYLLIASGKPRTVHYISNTQAIPEDKIWDAYNMTRDVEAVFRCLKTDLDIRPIHHQKDEYIEPHIWLGIVAYQVVNYIRRNLKEQEIHYSWSTIVGKMKNMQSSIVTVNNEKDEKIYVKLCTRPSKDQKAIFDALNFKHRPFVRKTKVLTQM